jgi:hypothetical protein
VFSARELSLFFFVVSKERVTKNYSNAKGKKYPIFSYNFQPMDLWSIKFGSWDLAADKSALELIKITNKNTCK